MATPRPTRDPLFLGRWFQDEVIIVGGVYLLSGRNLWASILAHGNRLTHLPFSCCLWGGQRSKVIRKTRSD